MVPVVIAIFAVVENEMLDKRLAVNALAREPGSGDGLVRLPAGRVHDVERRLRDTSAIMIARLVASPSTSGGLE
jgi:hypothetical protein